MRKTVASIVAVAVILLSPLAGYAQNGRVSLDSIAKAMGAANLKSLEFTGNGMIYAVGQSPDPGAPWPRSHLKSTKRTVNYETASLREENVRTQVLNPPRGGGGQPIRGEQKQNFAVSGNHAWNVVGDAAVPAPLTLAQRQFDLWATPHGVVKAAMANKATVEGRTISFAVPGRFKIKATVNDRQLVTKVDALVAHAVVGDLPVEVTYSAYDDFGGVMFPRIIQASAGGFPTLTMTVDGVKPNAPANIQVPDPVRQAANYYSRVTTEKMADGVWYLTGTTHHSVVIEMKDHVIVVEAPQNEERALAVLAEARKLVPSKPIRYLVNTHHHYDHSGGLRAAAAEGVTVVTSEVNRPFLEWALSAPATVGPDRMAKAKGKATVEGVGDKRVMTDGARVVEIHQIAGNLHHDGLIMVYLPKEKLLIETDAFTPGPPNAQPPRPANPFSVNLSDNIMRLGLNADRILPLHGRAVPLSELSKAIGK
jgi:glyoxylase-like metal-dependent hydrolase (beta-lactamase superfamily II)